PRSRPSGPCARPPFRTRRSSDLGAAPARRLQAMPMRYAYTAIADADVPRASFPFAQHLLDTYASESNKVVSVWREFSDADLEYRDRKSTRLNSSHVKISYAVFCL